MKIGIIVYSKTGNTLSVAEKLKSELTSNGHRVTLERIQPLSSQNDSVESVRFGELPDLSGYDGYVFAAPTQAFSLCPVMKAYFIKASSISGKKAAAVTTQHFKFAWLGGNNAIRKIGEGITSHGGVFAGGGVVNWTRKDRDAQAEQVVREIASLL